MKGSCHCGAIQYTITGKPSWTGRCHCFDCQKNSGSGFMPFAEFDVKEVSFTGEPPTEYRSSERITRTFCRICGSNIGWISEDDPNKTSIALGTLHEDFPYDVTDDLFIEHKRSWDAA